MILLIVQSSCVKEAYDKVSLTVAAESHYQVLSRVGEVTLEI